MPLSSLFTVLFFAQLDLWDEQIRPQVVYDAEARDAIHRRQHAREHGSGVFLSLSRREHEARSARDRPDPNTGRVSISEMVSKR
jgi:hypothetical protein